jgi:hypothetical protein
VLPAQYKKQRSINAVSITVLLALVALGYAGWEYARVAMQRQEAYRVLEETSSAFAGRSSLYREDADERETLRQRMQVQLHVAGVTDPEAETWIELEKDGAHFGVVYTAEYRWPFDVRAPIERDIQIEHVIAILP